MVAAVFELRMPRDQRSPLAGLMAEASPRRPEGVVEVLDFG
jgi:hypothetical protein